MSSTTTEPLVLAQEIHPDHHSLSISPKAVTTINPLTPPNTPPDSPNHTLSTSPTTAPAITLHPFSKHIPDNIDPNYLTTCAPGLQYALYTLVPITKDSTQVLLDALAFHALCEDSPPAIVLAPTHDFSHPRRATIRDIYDYHTSLLTVIRSNPWNLHPTRFLILCHQDWECNGLLLVELDTHPEIKGVVGMSRVAVDMAGSSLVLKEQESYTFADFKVEENARSFPEGIEGYEGSKWEVLERAWYEEGEYIADDEASEEPNEQEDDRSVASNACDGAGRGAAFVVEGSHDSCKNCDPSGCGSRTPGMQW